jgi:hypothetical protein
MSSWYDGQQQDLAMLERRKGFLGRNRVAALAGAYTLVGISVLLTALMFAAIANVGSKVTPSASLTTMSQGDSSLQVVRSDPLALQQVRAYLSAPGRVALNGAAAAGTLVAEEGAPLAMQGALSSGDTLRVCTDLPAAQVELRLVDMVSGAELARQAFLAPPVCAI